MAFHNERFIAALRVKIGNQSLRSVAEQSGVSVSTLSRLLANNSAPSVDTFATLVTWLHMSPSAFFSEEKQQTTVESAWADLFYAMNRLHVSSALQEAIAQVIRVCFPLSSLKKT
jgi:transcriptional regulator with XRE-family HTH domain